MDTQEENGLRTYVHLGTGNYNPRTASVYSDFGLLRYLSILLTPNNIIIIIIKNKNDHSKSCATEDEYGLWLLYIHIGIYLFIY
jgi:hypothetical protein